MITKHKDFKIVVPIKCFNGQVSFDDSNMTTETFFFAFKADCFACNKSVHGKKCFEKVEFLFDESVTSLELPLGWVLVEMYIGEDVAFNEQRFVQRLKTINDC